MMISRKMKTREKNKKVVLGLSGGVDSTAAALLLKEKDYEVTGLYFDIKSGVPGMDAEGRLRAETAARELGIDFIYRDVSREFEAIVIENFCREYSCGRTPNPCIVCNPAIKFRTLTDAADEVGAYYIATGHYADTYYHEDDGRWYVKCAANREKDQSYMLYRLGQNIISRLLLPLNEIEDKEDVREIARSRALKNSEAKDSQEICFIDDDDNYKNFLCRRGYASIPGDFVDREGNVLGEHKGILNYTVGQRKGLGIALGKPVFVTKIEGDNNRVVLGTNEDLFSREVISGGNILYGEDVDAGARKDFGEKMIVSAKIRYASKPASAVIEMMADGRIKTLFNEPQRAATPGQSIVFYKDDFVIGGGFIE